MKTIVVRRQGHCPPYSDAFMEALAQLSRKQGGGYVVKEKIEDLAATLHIVEPVKLPPLPVKLPPLLPPLPK
jgi:hypothetical protein